MNILLHDNNAWKRFAPLTLTRPVGDLRMGVFTNTERWRKFLPDAQIFFQTEEYLVNKYPVTESTDITVNACLIPTKQLMEVIVKLNENDCLMCQNEWLAKKGNGTNRVYWNDFCLIINQRWHLYQFNDIAIKQDFEFITEGKTSQQLSSSNTIIGDVANIFLEDGAKVEAAILNATNGPIYIAKDAEIMEGSIVRGPLAMLEHSTLKLDAKV